MQTCLMRSSTSISTEHSWLGIQSQPRPRAQRAHVKPAESALLLRLRLRDSLGRRGWVDDWPTAAVSCSDSAGLPALVSRGERRSAYAACDRAPAPADSLREK